MSLVGLQAGLQCSCDLHPREVCGEVVGCWCLLGPAGERLEQQQGVGALMGCGRVRGGAPKLRRVSRGQDVRGSSPPTAAQGLSQEARLPHSHADEEPRVCICFRSHDFSWVCVVGIALFDLALCSKCSLPRILRMHPVSFFVAVLLAFETESPCPAGLGLLGPSTSLLHLPGCWDSRLHHCTWPHVIPDKIY